VIGRRNYLRANFVDLID